MGLRNMSEYCILYYIFTFALVVKISLIIAMMYLQRCGVNGRFLERKICNPLVNVADRLKKLRGSGQFYLVNVKIVLM